MNISSINSSSSAMMSGAMKRPDPSKMANDLFSKLDTSGKGYIEKSDLETALSNMSESGSSSGATTSSKAEADALFSKMDSNGNGKVTKEEMSATVQKIAAELDGQSPRMRLQGGSPPPPQGGSSASPTGNSTSNQTSSDPADTNGDGTVSAIEALAYEISQASSSTTNTSSSSISSTDAQSMQKLAGNIRTSQDDDQGFTKDQLTTMSKELSSTDSKKSKVMSDIASNFDAADTNGDGKVTGTEARAFEKSKSSSNSSTAISSSTSSSDAQFMKKMMELLKSYGSFDQTTENSSFSTSA
jgi:Ca2+-binding EF-hand superfamily protein